MKKTRALCEAVALGARKQVTNLIDEGADINGIDVEQARTPLTTAIERGIDDMVVLLLQLGADPAIRPKRSHRPESPIHLAALRGNLEVVRALIARGVNVNAVIKPHNSSPGRTPLMNAAVSGNLDVAQLLIDNGAQVDARDEDGRTALTWSQSDDMQAFLTDLLSRQPVDPQPGDLAAAVQDGMIDRAEVLLNAGLPVDDVSPRGESALMVAVDKGDLKMARLLIARGADVNFRSEKGWLPITSYTIKKRMITLLLENGADPQAVMSDGDTALFWAFQSGSKQLVQAMLEAGGRLELNESQQRALLKGVRGLNRGVLPLLREHLGVEADEVDRIRAHAKEFARLGETPQFQAVSGRIGELFHRKPAPWKRRKGVVYFYNVSVVKYLSAYFGEDAGDTRDTNRAWNLLARYGREVFDEGYTLIMRDFLSDTGRFPLLLFPTANQHSVLAAVGTNGINYGLDTDALIRWFLELEKTHPFYLVDAGRDFVGGRFTGPVADAGTLVESMLKFCPDIRNFADADCRPWTHQQVVAAISSEVKQDGGFGFWWD